MTKDIHAMSPLSLEAGFDPARLERDYNAKATVSVEEFAAQIERYRAESLAQRDQWGRHFDVVYDAESGQRLDIFAPRVAQKMLPVFVFIHGGYWRRPPKRIPRRRPACRPPKALRQSSLTIRWRPRPLPPQ